MVSQKFNSKSAVSLSPRDNYERKIAKNYAKTNPPKTLLFPEISLYITKTYTADCTIQKNSKNEPKFGISLKDTLFRLSKSVHSGICGCGDPLIQILIKGTT